MYHIKSTKIGFIMSIISLFSMVILFTCETYEFVQTKVTSNIEIDPNADKLIRVNFNVTLYDVQCDFVEVGTYFSCGFDIIISYLI